MDASKRAQAKELLDGGGITSPALLEEVLQIMGGPEAISGVAGDPGHFAMAWGAGDETGYELTFWGDAQVLFSDENCQVVINIIEQTSKQVRFELLVEARGLLCLFPGLSLVLEELTTEPFGGGPSVIRAHLPGSAAELPGSVLSELSRLFVIEHSLETWMHIFRKRVLDGEGQFFERHFAEVRQLLGEVYTLLDSTIIGGIHGYTSEPRDMGGYALPGEHHYQYGRYDRPHRRLPVLSSLAELRAALLWGVCNELRTVLSLYQQWLSRPARYYPDQGGHFYLAGKQGGALAQAFVEVVDQRSTMLLKDMASALERAQAFVDTYREGASTTDAAKKQAVQLHVELQELLAQIDQRKPWLHALDPVVDYEVYIAGLIELATDAVLPAQTHRAVRVMADLMTTLQQAVARAAANPGKRDEASTALEQARQVVIKLRDMQQAMFLNWTAFNGLMLLWDPIPLEFSRANYIGTLEAYQRLMEEAEPLVEQWEAQQPSD